MSRWLNAFNELRRVDPPLSLRESRFETAPPQSISQNPSEPLLSALAGSPVAAGTRVSEATAEGIPAVFACVAFLAETVGQTPLKLMRRTERGRVADQAHPLYALLHDLPNPEMTAYDFRSTMMRWLTLWGNAYAEIVRDSQGRITSLWPLRSDRMTIGRDKLNRLAYRYDAPDGKTITYTFDAGRPPILHLRIHSLDGINGRSPIRVLRESLGLTLAASEYGARFFGGDGSLRGVLQTSGTLTSAAKQNLRESWTALYGGVQGKHRIAILEQDLKYQAIGVPPEDAQFLQTRKFQLQEAARAYRVPLHLIGDLERSTNNNIEHQGIEVVKFTLMPYFVSWEQSIKRDLLTAKSFNTHDAVFVVNALVRGDMLSRFQAYAIARQWGWMAVNDVLSLEDSQTIANGDRYLEPMNMVEAGSDPIAVEPAAPSMPMDEPEGIM